MADNYLCRLNIIYMKKTMVIVSAAAILCACSKKNLTETVKNANEQTSPTTEAGATITWNMGTLPANSNNAADLIVPNNLLCNLGVAKTGSPIYVSNNPEVITGSNGWLMQNARTDATRGGRKYFLKGTNILYLFHINKTVRTSTDNAVRFIHVLVSNPRPAGLSISYKGSCYTNVAKPLTGIGTGPCYAVADDWLKSIKQPIPTALPINKTIASFPQFNVREIFKAQLNELNMIDGRFEVTASDSAVYYVVITKSGNSTDAINASQGSYASGDYFEEVPNDFGREAGIYKTHRVTATNTITLPSNASYIGFSLNTTNKFFQVEDQNSDSLMVMRKAASKSYGNYGHYYKVICNITNTGTTSRNVKFYFASNAVGGTDPNMLLWNGPINSNGAIVPVYNIASKPRQEIASWTVDPGTFVHTLEFFVPGLITSNQQIIYQVN